MPKIKKLSGIELIKTFERFGFAVINQKGSHVKLRRSLKDSTQTLTIPKHREVDKGTIIAVYKQALRFIPEEKLRACFYSS